ncbi:hypothetical protein [Paenibacillus sp. NPDC055715]
MSHEKDPIQASTKHEHIYHIPEQWGDGVHRTHFLRKGFELSYMNEVKIHPEMPGSKAMNHI